MTAHEARKRRNKNQVQFAWFMSTNIIPPSDVPTDDEFAESSGAAEFRGRRVVRRKLRNGQDQDQFLSKYRKYFVFLNIHDFKLILGSYPSVENRLMPCAWSDQVSVGTWMTHFVVITRVNIHIYV